ncbi:hypothetical protein LCGC14_1644240 [marine sediment metagenome]|uniref:CcmD family protein n=1 Tax=marine sediment metagenome TaxID=412755 RepID=A0A0F9HYQ3_9ZZZZ
MEYYLFIIYILLMVTIFYKVFSAYYRLQEQLKTFESDNF